MRNVGAVPLNVLFEMDGGAGELRITVLSDEHLANADPPILFRLDGKSMEESMTHSSKAEPPIDSIPSLKVSDVRPVQPSKAELPIDVTVAGMFRDLIH